MNNATEVQECDATKAEQRSDAGSTKIASIEPLLIKTHKASASLRKADDEQIVKTLQMLANAVEANIPEILEANKSDLLKLDANDSKADRLRLSEQRIKNIANSIRLVSKLPNPSQKSLEERTLYNGLKLQRMSVPLGVVGVIFESRPNVTFDIAVLCLRSMNGCLLKGSREAENSNKIAVEIIKSVLKRNDIDEDCITLLPVSREIVQQLYTATKYVDVLIPRGSESLIQAVRKNSLVPVIETGAGVCHIYVEKDAEIEKAVNIVVNAKVSRPSVCNAVDSILVDRAAAPQFFDKLQPLFEKHGVEIHAHENAYELLKNYPHLHPAAPADFAREFISLRCAVKVVEDMDEALEHIAKYSTKHSEAIISENINKCELFLQEVDSAVVYMNASTRFTDGEEFGLGAEIGISTQKLHARGPFALEKLVTEKWVIRGDGQVRE